jgi:Domain of unknown function (DUF1707)
VADPGALRASDADRDRALELLREASVDGRLTVEELTERAERVQLARTHGDLAAATSDLAPAPPAPAAPVEESVQHRAILSSLVREGRWRPARRNRFVAVLGSVRLDMREAVLPGPEVEIDLVSVLGSAEVLLPEGVHVEVSGGGALSSEDVRIAGDPPPGAPVVRIRAGGALGSVAVRSRPGLGDRVRDYTRQLVDQLGDPRKPS